MVCENGLVRSTHRHGGNLFWTEAAVTLDEVSMPEVAAEKHADNGLD